MSITIIFVENWWNIFWGEERLKAAQECHLAAMTTRAPNSLNLMAMPLPRPVPPPEMKTTFPENVPFGSIVSFLFMVITLYVNTSKVDC
jgi:hypothetical protein